MKVSLFNIATDLDQIKTDVLFYTGYTHPGTPENKFRRNFHHRMKATIHALTKAHNDESRKF